jgi:hypothetical protein
LRRVDDRVEQLVAAEALLPVGWRVRREQARYAEALRVAIDGSRLVRDDSASLAWSS